MPFRSAGVTAAGARFPYATRLRHRAAIAATPCLGAARRWAAGSADLSGHGLHPVLRQRATS
jgi:hypothetical protein